MPHRALAVAHQFELRFQGMAGFQHLGQGFALDPVARQAVAGHAVLGDVVAHEGPGHIGFHGPVQPFRLVIGRLIGRLHVGAAVIVVDIDPIRRCAVTAFAGGPGLGPAGIAGLLGNIGVMADRADLVLLHAFFAADGGGDLLGFVRLVDRAERLEMLGAFPDFKFRFVAFLADLRPLKIGFRRARPGVDSQQAKKYGNSDQRPKCTKQHLILPF